MTPIRILATALLALSVALPAHAQVADYSGSWSLDTTILLSGEAAPCVFNGYVTVQQQGSALTGSAFQFLSSGPDACPSMMMAAVSGQVDMMGCVELGALSGPLGTSSFVACPGEGVDALVGTFEVESGPFAGEGGEWIAVPGAASLSIPVLGGVGLTALAAMLLLAGAWLLRRRRRAS